MSFRGLSFGVFMLVWVVCKVVLVNAQPSSYAVWAADSAISRKQGIGLDNKENPVVSYEHGELQWALRLLFAHTGDFSYYLHIITGLNNIVFDNGTVHGAYVLTDYSLDPIRTGPSFLYQYEELGDHRWTIAADTFKTQLETHPRTPQGQFWHKKRYPNQGWLDGIYMADVFYAQYTQDFQPSNTSAWSDIVSQFSLMYQNTIQTPGVENYIGLMYHGYDYSQKAVWAFQDRGHSPEVWIRAQGWYMMALVDTLEIIPESITGRETILQILQTLAPRIRDAADPASGVWWLVMTQPGREGNYLESSGSAMFVYSLLKGVRLGYIPDDDGSIVKAARKAYQYMVENWVVENDDGTMGWKNTVQVGSLDGNGDFAYYVGVPIILNDLKGLAAFILASVEYEAL